MQHKMIFLGGLLVSNWANAMTSDMTNVPEPENMSLMMFGLGIIGLIVFSKK